MQKHNEPDYKRIFIAVALAGLVMLGWQMMVEWPRRQKLAEFNTQQVQKKAVEEKKYAEQSKSLKDGESIENPALTRDQRVAATPRVMIVSDKIHGSLSLKGLRFDDLTLSKYRTHIDKDSPAVILLSPNGDETAFFAQAGWLSSDGKTKVPDANTVWQSDKKTLKAGDNVTLRWDNGDGVTFYTTIALDEHYMFDITQKVDNRSGRDISVAPYGYINRTRHEDNQALILHEGPIAVSNGTLEETSYKDLREKKSLAYENAAGWVGITDHYWLTALIPSGDHNKMTFSHYESNNRSRYQADYAAETFTVANNDTASYDVRLFAGAKELDLLDHYTSGKIDPKQRPVPLLDRSLDFGMFYFLAKPMSEVMHLLYTYTGNFGIAILIFIIIVKALMFPLANKSYKSMSQMRDIQPEMVKIRERYVDDQIGMHKAMRDLYKQKKINPAAGCLPVLIQIIVFLALFRGLNVNIEMRHAPFYGWIQDLSAPDPSNLFTLFGLVPWDAPHWLHLGLLPILYTITMVVQMKQQPKPADPVQAKMMSFMPYMLLLFFDKMASGFVLYWTWSNIISIFQQQYITKSYHKSIGHKAAKSSEA